MDIILDEKSDIIIPSKKPEKLSHDSFPVDFFCCEEWKSLRELVAMLTTEETIGDITRTKIFIVDTMINEFSTEIEILKLWMRHRRKD